MSAPPTLRYRLCAETVVIPHRSAPTTQYLLIDRVSRRPSMLGCLYGAHLAQTTKKPNTAKKEVEAVALLLTWSMETVPNLPIQLAKGQPLTLSQTRNFTAWLQRRSDISANSVSPSKARTYNAALASTRRFIDWCLIMGNEGDGAAMDNALKTSSKVWDMMGKMPVHEDQHAQDLEDDEIREIESFLFGLAFPAQGRARHVHVRDYLMWRLAIEYGLRIGEILALRDVDLPTRDANHLKIVRTDHRDNETDPRTPNAPQVKTLGRDLGYYFRNTRFPGLFNRYINDFRWVWATRKSGARYQKNRFSHPFLLVNTTDGMPLSIQTAEARAAWISKETGIAFKWHKCRHSFFNRAYVAMDALQDPHERAERKAGLVYWGGWSDESSLDIYTRAAQRNKGRRGSFALEGSADSPEWEAIA